MERTCDCRLCGRWGQYLRAGELPPEHGKCGWLRSWRCCGAVHSLGMQRAKLVAMRGCGCG